MELTYSFCTTVFNSVETIGRFIERLEQSRFPHEIIIVDSNSDDGTYEEALKHQDVKVIREKCTRGRGRQIAIENAANNVIVMLDADVDYIKIDDLLENFENSDKNGMLWNVVCRDEYGTTPAVIASRNLVQRLGGYPDINAGEDSYLRLISESANVYHRLSLPAGNFQGMSVNGKISGNERRYNRSIAKAIRRRMLFTRDALFVHHYSYRELLDYYKLRGLRGKIIGLAEYLTGIMLVKLFREQTVDERVRSMDLSSLSDEDFSMT